MDRDFTLATELTEDDIGGGRLISVRPASASGSSGLNLNAATNGGWGLVVGVLALWAVWWLFPGNQRQPPKTPPPPAVTGATAAHSPGRPRPEAITVEMGPNGIVINHGPTAHSTPASGIGKARQKAAPAASQPARSRTASAAAAAHDE